MTQAVDLQVLLPRAQEVGRIQHIQQSNEQTQQQSFATHLVQDADRAQRTVQNLPQAKEARIRGEEHRRRDFNDRQNSQKKSKTSTDTSGENREQVDYTGVGNHIDLKI